MSQEGHLRPTAPGEGRNPKEFGFGLWEKVLGVGGGADCGNQAAGAGRGRGHCSQLALISQEPASCVRSAWMYLGIFAYIYIMCVMRKAGAVEELQGGVKGRSTESSEGTQGKEAAGNGSKYTIP